MKEIYVSPEDLKTGYRRKLLKVVAKNLGGGLVLDYSPRLIMKETKMMVRQAKVGIYVPDKKKGEAVSILKMLGFRIVGEKDALGIFEESIIVSMLIPLEEEEGVPIGIDLSGDHMVLLPLKRVLFFGLIDYRLPLYLANLESNVCWIDSKGLRKPLELGFEEVTKIPLNSMTRYALSELSRVIGALTIGERYASDILNAITNPEGEELFSDTEIPLVGRETQALKEVIESGLLTRGRERLSGRIYLSVQGFGTPAIVSAITAILLSFPGLVIINSDVWHQSILPIINRREGIIWVSRNPAMQLAREFEYKIYAEGDYYVLSRSMYFEGEMREVRKRFIPIWRLYSK